MNAGKDVGQDYLDHKWTLPVILAYQNLPKSARRRFQQLWNNPDKKHWSEVQALLREHAIDSRMQEYIQNHVQEAENALESCSIQEKEKKMLIDLLVGLASRVE